MLAPGNMLAQLVHCLLQVTVGPKFDPSILLFAVLISFCF
jgi:hypothetical protein